MGSFTLNIEAILLFPIAEALGFYQLLETFNSQIKDRKQTIRIINIREYLQKPRPLDAWPELSPVSCLQNQSITE